MPPNSVLQGYLEDIHLKSYLWTVLITAFVASSGVQSAAAQDVDCGNEFRGGKLYLDNYQRAKNKKDMAEARRVLEKGMESFKLAAEGCPNEKSEYRWHYAIILAEAGDQLFEDAAFEADEAKKESMYQEAVALLTKSGSEFTAAADSTEDGTKGKNRKAVRNNRGHYWVDHWNAALESMEKEDYHLAATHFDACRGLDPANMKAYPQGAVALIRKGDRDRALKLVEEGLALDIELFKPNDDMRKTQKEDAEKAYADAQKSQGQLMVLRSKIYSEYAEDYARGAEEEKSPEKARKALEYYDSVVEWEQDDPNIYLQRGIARLVGAGIIAAEDEAEAKGLYTESVEDFRQANSIFPKEDEKAGEFQTTCLFYQIQALNNAEDYDSAFATAKEYVCLSPLDAQGWDFLFRSYVQREDQTNGVAALTMKKALAANEVDPSEINPTKDAKAAVAERGQPDKVYSYQDGNTQISTYVWLEKKVATHYILGASQGDLTWCQ